MRHGFASAIKIAHRSIAIVTVAIIDSGITAIVHLVIFRVRRAGPCRQELRC